MTAHHYTNAQNSIISFGYVDSYAKIFLILYPLLENSTTRITIICKSQWTIISSSIYSNTGSIEILPKSHEISIITYTGALVNSDKIRPTSISSFIIKLSFFDSRIHSILVIKASLCSAITRFWLLGARNWLLACYHLCI